ncbi:MAG: 3-hydroxyacyl-CoA dehydrogenase family protein, partial [Phototrophicaceae bacterium]
MTYRIQKAAVIGAGTMGSAIAALLAGVGVPTMLLDIPAPDSAVGDKPAKRNAFALKGIERLKNSRPSELYEPADLDLITPGNTEDHLHLLADADWVVEVVIEKLDVKRALFGKLAEVVKPNAILSSNTSGLPIRDIADGMGSEFSRRFMGTHFFNPPRYLPLLELIPHPDADPEAVAFMQQFLSARLGRGVVIANDEPNFIGNRFMSMLSSQTVNHAIDNALTVDEVDAITGPLIGRPKSATFRLSDVVGNDIAWHVGANLYPAIPNDPHREILQHPGTTAVYQWLLENKYLGNKTGQGFYKRVDVNGEKQFWSLNLTTLEYEAPIKVRLESVGKHRKVESLGERIRLLMVEEDKAGAFLFHHFAFYLTYASQRVPEITESLVSVDNAQKWGFAHEMGPFEIWDAIGVADSAARFAAAGYTIAAWVEQMLESGKTHFYQRDSSGKVIGVYSPITGDYTPLEADTKQIKVAHLRADQKLVKKNSGGAILDMGDGIALLEMTTDNSVIDGDFVQMGMQA